MKVYLAGSIYGSKIEQCKEWRKKIRDHYHNYKGQRYPIDWLDPVNGEDTVELSPDGTKSNIPSAAIHLRDHTSVTKLANLVIANMDRFGETRYPIGTIMEVAWAWHCQVPVIVISNEETYKNHPMFATATAILVPSVEELLEKKWIQFFYKGWNSAIY